MLNVTEQSVCFFKVSELVIVQQLSVSASGTVQNFAQFPSGFAEQAQVTVADTVSVHQMVKKNVPAFALEHVSS